MDAAAKLVNAGVSIKHKTLHMGNVKGTGMTPPDAETIPKRVRQVLDQLEPNALMQLREAALQASRLCDDELPDAEDWNHAGPVRNAEDERHVATIRVGYHAAGYQRLAV